MDTQNEEYELSGPDADAKGVFKDKGFLVKAGSWIRGETVHSSKRVDIDFLRLLNEGVLEEYDGKLRFTKDYLFKTPSSAARAVLGRAVNGWISWKSSDGQTLSKIKRVSRDTKAQLLSDSKRKEISDRYQQLLNSGKLATTQQLDKEYSLFREKFGPAVLSALDGEALLNLMHDHGNRDSLVYWLEFKNDDEFETLNFGSIAGGSALKFRIFRRKETGNWQAGIEKANQPEDISTDEAIEIARRHRDQFLLGIVLLEKLESDATDEDYAAIQDQMKEIAPDVSLLAWGHKYFSLLFPEKLDDYHNPDLQRFHLLKLMHFPPDVDGRYICAGRFVAAAKEVGLRMSHFTSTLNSIHHQPHHYWRIGTTSGNSKVSGWQMMREHGCIAVGWPKLGDLSWVEGKKSKGKLKALMAGAYTDDPQTISRDITQISQFVTGISEGDVVVAADGMTIFGIGKVIGSYEYNSKFEFPHQRQVEWLTTEEWMMPEPDEELKSTVQNLGKFTEILLAIEQQIQSPNMSMPKKNDDQPTPNRPVRLTGVSGRIQSVLERKSQVVLYGPPGTGKTFWAERSANDLAALSAYGKLFEALDETERTAVIGHGDNAGFVRLCCFHPAYGYEDFLEGYRPKTVDGQVSFELRDGVFKKLCKDANASPERNFYLIVDEINRGDIPRIFGELLTTLERDKRGKRVILPVSQEIFSVPRNVFLIGTMNTADRSISLLDAALRRRFGFVELMPDTSVFKDSLVSGVPLKAWLDALNERIREHVGRDARNLQIGHSYLMHGGSPLKDLATLKRAIRDDIIPLLEEYCYEDFGTLENILGDQIVDVLTARVRHELFEDGQEDALVQGLLAPFADISTSSEVLSSEESQFEVDEDEEGDMS